MNLRRNATAAIVAIAALTLAGCNGEGRDAAPPPAPTTSTAVPTTLAPPPCEVDQRRDYLAGGPGHPSPEEAARAGVAPGPWRFERLDGDRSHARLRVVNGDTGQLVAVAEVAAEDGQWRLVAADRCKGAPAPSPV